MTAGPAAGRWWTGMTKRIYPERTLVMPTTTAIPAPRLIGVDGLGALIEALVADGYQVIGPAVQDGAIVLRDLSSAAELPSGWGVELEAVPAPAAGAAVVGRAHRGRLRGGRGR